MVLAILGAHLGERVTTDRLIDAMWGDDPPKSAVSAIQVYVSKIRRLFEPGLAAGATSSYLRSDAGAYVLDLPIEAVDVASFAAVCHDPDAGDDAVVASLDLWRGDPFAEFTDAPWALTRSVELRQIRLRAVQRRYATAISAGRDGEIVDALRTDVAEYPYEERLTGLLMTALYRLGDQRGALEVYTTTRTLLVDELGLDPTPELQELQRLILQHDASLLEGMRLRPPRSTPGPVGRPAMYGRAGDVERAESALRDHRLVTVTGPGGVGKTRLAQELVDRRPGSAMVDLASSGTIADALAQTAAALGIEGDPLTATVASIAQVLDTSHHFIVLDNCEQLLPDLGATITAVLAESSAVRIVCTSRRSIAVSNEAIVRLEPLAAPASLAGTPPLEEVAASPGVRILTARSGIDLTAENAADIIELHRRLDGLPLALELAAFRLRTLGAVDLAIATTPDDRTGPRDLPERHRSLDAVLESSMDTLSTTQLRVLERLSVFAGAVPLEAIVRLLEDEISAVEVRIAVSDLVDRNLVALRPTSLGVRYRLLETVRSHCRTRWDVALDGPPDPTLVEMLRNVAQESLSPTASQITLTDLDDEVGAVLAQLEHAAVDAQLHLSLLTPVATYWYGVGRVRDARLRLRAALEAHPDAPPPLIGLSSALLGMISFGDGAYDELARYTHRALTILEPLGFPGLDFVRAGHHIGAGELVEARDAIDAFLADPSTTGRPRLAGLEVSATTSWFSDDLDLAMRAYREQQSIAVAERDPYFEAHALRGEALMAALAGRPERGLDLCRTADEIVVPRSADRPRTERLATSAVIRRVLGDEQTAGELARDSLAACVRQFDATAATLTTPIAASDALVDGDAQHAARLIGWYDALCRSTGLYGPTWANDLLQRVSSEVEAQLEGSAWIRLRADGASMGLGAVLRAGAERAAREPIDS